MKSGYLRLVLLLSGVFVLAALSACKDDAPPPTGKQAEPDLSKLGSPAELEDDASTAVENLPVSSSDKAEEKTEAAKTTVGDLIDYGTGVTPLRVKKQQTKRLKNIQDQHNKQLMDAMEE